MPYPYTGHRQRVSSDTLEIVDPGQEEVENIGHESVRHRVSLTTNSQTSTTLSEPGGDPHSGMF